MLALALRSVFAGVCFGIWPLLINRSGLGGNVASLMFTLVIVACLVPFGVSGIGTVSSARWPFILLAGAISAAGLLAFNGMLARTTAVQVAPFFVVMILTQTAVPAVYQAWISGSLPPIRAAGFALAAVAGVLLLT